MPNRKRLMVLGAGHGQLPVLRKANECDVRPITVDNVPSNPGHKLSHSRVNCSTVDREQVLVAAKRHSIDGIVTFASDIATPAVAYVAEQLSLRGCSLSTAETMSDKARFRRIQQSSLQLSSPRFESGVDFVPLFMKSQALTPPLVFKPADTSGSKGISKVDNLDVRLCRQAFELAQSFSRSKTVCVEELLVGLDLSGDGFLFEGRLYAEITRKHKNRFVPIGHTIPSGISVEDRTRIVTAVEANCAAVGYRNGPIDFDVMLTPASVTVIEMSPRLGGNGIPALVERATGVDFTSMTIRWALGEKIDPPVMPIKVRPCASWIFGSPCAGVASFIASPQVVRSAIPECFDCSVLIRPGDVAPAFTHSGNALGSVLFDCPQPDSFSEITARVERALGISIEAAATAVGCA